MSSKLASVTGSGKGKAILEQPTSFNATSGPGPSKPPLFASSSDWAATQLCNENAGAVQRSTEATWPHQSMTVDPPQNQPLLTETRLERNESPINLELGLGSSSSNPAPLSSPQPPVALENHNHPPLPSNATSSHELCSAQMAFQRADPGPFIPDGMHLQHVENSQFMVRAVASSRPIPRHEDWAIVTINPLPGNVLDFDVVREVLEEFFVEVARVQIKSIQRSHLGQALVQFHRIYDRDNLVLTSPHQFDNVQVSFVRHNQGRNWRRVQFNREVWLILLGLPFDYWEEEYIDNVLGPFGRMISWDRDLDNRTWLLVKARVMDLESIPHFVVFSDTEAQDSDSWTIPT